MLFYMIRLSRLVVDKVHIALLSDQYRESLCSKKRVKQFFVSVPILLTIATVPKNLKIDTLIANGCSPRITMMVTRSLCRSDIFALVEPLGEGFVLTVISAVTKWMIKTFQRDTFEGGKHLIVALFQNHCDEQKYQNKISCLIRHLYWSITAVWQKQKSIVQWKRGSNTRRKSDSNLDTYMYRRIQHRHWRPGC